MISAKTRTILTSLISMRTGTSSDQEIYSDSFKNEDIFISIDEEFIPLSLLKQHQDSGNILKELKASVGLNTIVQPLDRQLSAFYRNHHLKRDIYNIADSITYYVVPNGQEHEVTKSGNNQFINVNKIIELSQYADMEYSAKDKFLKSIGHQISKNVLMPVNFWLDTLSFSDFEKEPERYWQVAGIFKPFLWGKLFRNGHVDKKIFFCVGIDLRNQTVFYGLECLRSGTNKLTADQLLKFDHYTNGKKLRKEIPLKEISNYNWNELYDLATKFIQKYSRLYDDLLDYIWHNHVDISGVTNKLLKINYDNQLFTDQEYVGSEKLTKTGIQLVYQYEIETLAIRGKGNLSKNVELFKDKENHYSYDIHSYNLDGSSKLIKVITSKSFSINGYTLPNEVIESSAEMPEKSYLYIIVGCSKKNKSGLLMVKKGNFESTLSFEPVLLKVRVK